MIGKQIPGRASGVSTRTMRGDFARLVAYVCGKAVAVEMRNVIGDLSDVADDMWLTAGCNDRCRTKTLHFVLSWPETEHPTPAQAIEAMEMLLTELGLEDHQAVMGVHADTDKLHVHAGVNAIHPLTFVKWRSSNSYARIELACRKIELAQGWCQDRGRFDLAVGEAADGPTVKLVPKPQSHWGEKTKRRAAGRGASQRDVETERRTGMPPLCDTLSEPWKMRIAAVLDGAKDWTAVHAGLRTIGLAYVRKGSGAQIRIIGSDTAMIASQLAGRFALGKMQKRLGPLTDAPDAGVATPATLPAHRPHRLRGTPAVGAEALTQAQTFKATLLARSYIGITLSTDVVRAIKRVDLDSVPPRITLVDGGVVADEGDGLSASEAGDVRVQAQLMVALALAKGWRDCDVTGSRDFLRAVAEAAAQAGLTLTGVPEDIAAEVAAQAADVAQTVDAATATDTMKPMAPVAATGPGAAHAAADAARAASVERRAQARQEGEARAAHEAADRAELATILSAEEVAATEPLARALAMGLDRHHRDQRRRQRESALRVQAVETVPLSAQDRRARAAQAVLAVQGADTALAEHADVLPPLDHTACRQLWAAADAIAPQTAGMDHRAVDAATRGDPARDLRVLPDGLMLFAHRDGGDNIVGFEMAREAAGGEVVSAFADGGRRAGWTTRDPVVPDGIVLTDWAATAARLAGDEDRQDTNYLSLGGGCDGDIAARVAELLGGAGKGEVVVIIEDDALAAKVLDLLPGAKRLNARDPDLLACEVSSDTGPHASSLDGLEDVSKGDEVAGSSKMATEEKTPAQMATEIHADSGGGGEVSAGDGVRVAAGDGDAPPATLDDEPPSIGI